MTPSQSISWLIVSLIFALFFSGSEAAFLSCDKFKFAIRTKKAGYMNYLYNTLFGHSKQFLATLAVGKTMALVFLVAFSLILLQFQTAGAAIPLSQLLIFILSLLLIIPIIYQLLPRLLFQHSANF